MRVVIQRVSEARVRVDGNVVGEVGVGFLVLLGIRQGDSREGVRWLVDKVTGLRVFPDDAGKMNRTLEDVQGGVLLISQFTLYGDCRKGRRPSFIEAAPSEEAIPLYEAFTQALRDRGIPTATGIFGADMQVELINAGPVTLILDSPNP